MKTASCKSATRTSSKARPQQQTQTATRFHLLALLKTAHLMNLLDQHTPEQPTATHLLTSNNGDLTLVSLFRGTSRCGSGVSQKVAAFGTTARGRSRRCWRWEQTCHRSYSSSYRNGEKTALCIGGVAQVVHTLTVLLTCLLISGAAARRIVCCATQHTVASKLQACQTAFCAIPF